MRSGVVEGGLLKECLVEEMQLCCFPGRRWAGE